MRCHLAPTDKTIALLTVTAHRWKALTDSFFQLAKALLPLVGELNVSITSGFKQLLLQLCYALIAHNGACCNLQRCRIQLRLFGSDYYWESCTVGVMHTSPTLGGWGRRTRVRRGGECAACLTAGVCRPAGVEIRR